MSRNLSTTSCHACHSSCAQMVIEETPRPITLADVPSVYFPECDGMYVAHAHCSWCFAKYLAWIIPPHTFSHNRARRIDQLRDQNVILSPFGASSIVFRDIRDPEILVCDLSYREAYNDEPASGDLPIFDVVLEPKRTLAAEHTYLAWAEPHEVHRHRLRQAAALAAGELGPSKKALGDAFLKALVIPSDKVFGVASFANSFTNPENKSTFMRTWTVLADMFEEHSELAMAAYARDLVARLEHDWPTELTHSSTTRRNFEQRLQNQSACGFCGAPLGEACKRYSTTDFHLRSKPR